jgi:hypothetical protein
MKSILGTLCAAYLALVLIAICAVCVPLFVLFMAAEAIGGVREMWKP